jgi:hypothetical protein
LCVVVVQLDLVRLLNVLDTDARFLVKLDDVACTLLHPFRRILQPIQPKAEMLSEVLRDDLRGQVVVRLMGRHDRSHQALAEVPQERRLVPLFDGVGTERTAV